MKFVQVGTIALAVHFFLVADACFFNRVTTHLENLELSGNSLDGQKCHVIYQKWVKSGKVKEFSKSFGQRADFVVNIFLLIEDLSRQLFCSASNLCREHFFTPKDFFVAKSGNF